MHAAALAANLARDAELVGARFKVGASGAGMAGEGPVTAPPVQYVSVAASVSGAGTETVTVGLVNAGGLLVQALTERAARAVLAGLPARWVQANVTALGGVGAEIDVNFRGMA